LGLGFLGFLVSRYRLGFPEALASLDLLEALEDLLDRADPEFLEGLVLLHFLELLAALEFPMALEFLVVLAVLVVLQSMETFHCNG
jgi:hypothetical protein